MTYLYQDPDKQHHLDVRELLKPWSHYQIQHLNVSSLYPHQIIDKISQLSSDCDVVVLHNGDVWRYSDSKELQEFVRNDGRKYLILTLGYRNQQIIPGMYELSMPTTYYLRHRLPYQPKSPALNYGFSCLNRRASLIRLLLGHRLYSEKLIAGMIFTQAIKDFPPSGSDQVLLDQVPDINHYLDNLPIRWHNETEADLWRVENLESVGHDAYKLAYCNIVTETETENFVFENVTPLPVITEKSFKPFTSCQLPIFLAAQGHMEYLEGLGFEVMSDLVCEGYDHLNTLGKIEAITAVVAKGSEFIKDYYFSHIKEIQHNHDMVSGRIIEERLSQRIKTFLEEHNF